MKIAAIIRSVPDTEAKLRILNKDINRSEIDFIVNPYDEYAVEEALKLREKLQDSSVDIYCIGPETADKQLKWALSVGADEAFRLSLDSWYNISEDKSAKILSDELKDKGYGFIFTGKKSIDYDISSLPFYLADLLNYKIMPSVVAFEYFPDENSVEMKAIIDNRKIVKKGEPPIIICCEKGLNEPRYPSLKNIMKAKKKEINTVSIDPEIIKGSLVKVQNLTVPVIRRKSEVLKGERPEIVKRLAEIISEEIKVL